MTASFFRHCTLLCPVVAAERRFFPFFSPSCKCWIIYLPANSQHCQHPVVKIYLCPDKCSSGLQSDYSLLPDILLDAVHVYTAVNHQLPITFLHKTRLVFKSGSKRERQSQGQLNPCLGALTEWVHGWVCVCVEGGVRGWDLLLHLMLYTFYCKVALLHSPCNSAFMLLGVFIGLKSWQFKYFH